MLTRSDNFNRAAALVDPGPPSDGGSNWVQALEPWGITTNINCYVSSFAAPGGPVALEYLYLGASAMDVQLTDVQFSGDSRGICPVVRLSDANNYIYFDIQTAGNSGIIKVVGGVETALVTFAMLPAPGDIFRLTVDVSNTLTAYQNGVVMGAATDSFNATARNAGMRETLFAGSLPAIVDDFSATEIVTVVVPAVEEALSYSVLLAPTDLVARLPVSNITVTDGTGSP